MIRQKSFCKDKAVYNAIISGIQIIDGKDKQHTAEAIPSILTEALAVAFDQNVGHDYVENGEERFEFYSQERGENRVRLDYFNKITKGGLPQKTLNIALAGTGVGNADVTVFIYGSEFQKGTAGMAGSLEANDFIFENKPIIIKDTYTVNGSDMAQIGWIEVTTEDGATGYLWYLKSEHETRLRFEDYLEMSVVEGEQVGATSAIAGVDGTEGLFAAIEGRGNTQVGFQLLQVLVTLMIFYVT